MTGGTPADRGSRGHRDTPLGRSPFADTVPAVVAAIAYVLVTLGWLAAGDRLPGGRWLVVHLFTLGILTNLVLAFSQHFGRTLTRSPDGGRGRTVVANVAIAILLVGLPTGNRWAVAGGATLVTAVVLAAYVRLRRWRRGAVGARFGWIVRVYERAHGAFVHGAILGLLMGVGALPGAWYGAARTAHLHVNILGWGGLTLLATIVFFGPTMARTRIVPGADERAARALRHGATGLTAATLLLVVTGIGGVGGTVARLGAAAALAVLAWATTVVCVPVARAAWRANPSGTRTSVVAVSLWFPVVVWADVAVVATGRWSLLDALGVAVIVGVLLQAISTVLVYLAPMLRGRGFAGRDRLLHRFERGATWRTAAYNVGALLLTVAATTDASTGPALARTGGALVAGTLLLALVLGLAPVRRGNGSGDVRSEVARRYRDPST